MTASFPLSVYRSPLSVCYPFTVIHDLWLMADDKCMVNSKRKMVNCAGGVL